MSGIRTLDDLRQRCWVDDQTECWNWRGALTNGRPSIWIQATEGHRGRALSAGGALSFLLTGKSVERGKVWVPICKNKACVSPFHRQPSTYVALQKLFRPSNSLAHRAKQSAGRQALSKLTVNDAQAIRESQEMGKDLAKQYGVSASVVSRIKVGKTWVQNRGTSVFGWRP